MPLHPHHFKHVQFLETNPLYGVNEFRIGRKSCHPVTLGTPLRFRSHDGNTRIYTFGISVRELPGYTFDVTVTFALENGRLLLLGGEKWVASPEVPGAGDVLFAFGIKEVIVSACIEGVTARMNPPVIPPLEVVRTVFRYGRNSDPKRGMAYVMELSPGEFYVEEWHPDKGSPYRVAGPLDEAKALAVLSARHPIGASPKGSG